jgi:hypothetical protein
MNLKSFYRTDAFALPLRPLPNVHSPRSTRYQNPSYFPFLLWLDKTTEATQATSSTAEATAATLDSVDVATGTGVSQP